MGNGRPMLLNGSEIAIKVDASPMLNPLSYWFRIVLFVNPDDEDDRTGKNVMTLGANAKLYILHPNPPRLIKHDH